MKMFKDSKGFTLVELLIVMAVVVVLAAAVLPKVSNVVAGASEANTVSALSAAYTDAYTQFMAKHPDGTTISGSEIVAGVDVKTTSFTYLTTAKVGGLSLMDDGNTVITGTLPNSGSVRVKFTFNDVDGKVGLTGIKVGDSTLS